MRWSQELKLRRYAACMIELNENLSSLIVSNASEEIGETELNEIILNSMPNGWSKPAYVQFFNCGYITFF